MAEHDDPISNDYTSPQNNRVIPLDAELKNKFERAFDVDLSRVRIHTGLHADEILRDIKAKAVTYGTDIYIGSRGFDPYTLEGVRLLAHEMTHVVQYIKNEEARYPEEIAKLEMSADTAELLFDDLFLGESDIEVNTEKAHYFSNIVPQYGSSGLQKSEESGTQGNSNGGGHENPGIILFDPDGESRSFSAEEYQALKKIVAGEVIQEIEQSRFFSDHDFIARSSRYIKE